MVADLVKSLETLRDDLLAESTSHAESAAMFAVTSPAHALDEGCALGKSYAAARLEAILNFLRPSPEIPVLRAKFRYEELADGWTELANAERGLLGF